MMSLAPNSTHHSSPAAIVLDPRGVISKALAELTVEGGPDLDIQALAEQAAVSVEWLYELDGGQLGPVDLAELERLCRILGRSPNGLLGYEADV
jgi:DNA-binding Xre family transcriptional regulator